MESQERSTPEKGRGLNKAQKVVLGATACGLAGAVAAAPWAASNAITDSEVEDKGPIPTNISLAPGSSKLDLGPAGSLYNREFEAHGLGVDVELTDPPAFLSSIASGESGDLNLTSSIERLASFYGDPAAVQEGYTSAIKQEVMQQFWQRELYAGLALTAMFGLGALALGGRKEGGEREPKQKVAAAGLVGVVALAPSALGLANYYEWQDEQALPDKTYQINSFEGTKLEGSVASNPLLAGLVNRGRYIYQEQLDNMEQANQEFLEQAYATIDRLIDSGEIDIPESDETMILALSDMHANRDMIKVWNYFVEQINKKHGEGTIALVTMNGDSSYGSVAAKDAIEAEAGIADGEETVSVNGNHGTHITDQQKLAAGMIVLKGESVTVDGLEILGDDDPQVTVLKSLLGLSSDIPRYDKGLTQQEAGRRLNQTAEATDPDMVMAHEGYMIGPVVGLENPSRQAFDKWFDAPRNLSGNRVDKVPDIAASLVTYGHWHRLSVPGHKLYRVVSNSDGTWSVVAEMGTAGGADSSLMLTSVSTPWTPPTETASGKLFTFNQQSGLVTGLQQIKFAPSGKADVDPAVHIGSPDGLPYPTEEAEAGKGQSSTQPDGNEAKPKVKVKKQPDGKVKIDLQDTPERMSETAQ